MTPRFTIFLLLAPLAAATPALAQNDQVPLVPGLEQFDIAPRTVPTIVPDRPQATPTPTPTPRATPAPRPTPSPRATPAPRATSTPRPVPTARPTATPTPLTVAPVVAPATEPAMPEATPSPAPDLFPPHPGAQSTAQPNAVPSAPTVGDDGQAFRLKPWMLALGIALLAALALAGLLLWRRRRRRHDRSVEIEIDTFPVDERALPAAATLPEYAPPGDAPPEDTPPADTPPAAAPPPPVVPTAPAPSFLRVAPREAPRARLEIAVRPIRAGTNLTSAAVDYEIEIRNAGDADASDVRLDLRLLSASADQDAILTALYAAPIDKPAVAPFALPAGQQLSLGGMAMLPNEALSILSVQGRDFFVPMLSVNLVYGWANGGRGQTASAHVVGIERGGDAKMAPFRLDAGPRMYDNVGERVHTLTVAR